jgi:peroxidase
MALTSTAAPGTPGAPSTLLPEFREIDGTGNNPVNANFNAFAGADELRLTDPRYAPGTTDGLYEGPDPRAISNLLAGGDRAEIEDTASGISGFSYVFGQFVDHDMDRTNSGGADISMKADGMTIPLTRFTMSEEGDSAINAVTGWLDLSQVYGSDAATAASLRKADGHLKTSSGNNLPIDASGNFVAGDIRVMENPQLSAITVLFVREHNFQVDRLKAENPNWKGDQLYNQAKAITTAEFENIVFTEFLPAIIGKQNIPAYNGYNPNVNPGIMQEFAHAAFRFGHSTVSDEQEKLDERGNVLENQSLANAMQNTVAQRLANGGLDALLRGPASDGANMVDTGAVNGLRNTQTGPSSLFDLIAVDIQRERDVGMGTFNKTREALGLRPIASFEALTNDPSVAADLHTLYDQYGGINAMDLFIGGLAEKHARGSTMGETFTTIIGLQFGNLRTGDRFYWENQAFDPTTKAMIGNTTLSQLIMRDTNTVNMQQNAFVETTRHSSDVESENPTAPQLVTGINRDNVEIAGGPNNDTIVAGTGVNQILTGNGKNDSDLFVIQGKGHNVTISDFDTTFDQIQFVDNAPLDMPVQMTAVSGGTVLTFDGNKVTLAGVSPKKMTSDNLTFLDSNAMVTNHGLVT